MDRLAQRFTLFFGLIAGFVACRGPAGPEGPPGPATNADVTQVSYGARTHDGNRDLVLSFPASLSVTAQTIERSALFVYVRQNATTSDNRSLPYWFALPGETATGNQYSPYIFAGDGATQPAVFIRRKANFQPGPETFDAVRVLLVPAGTVVNGRQGAVDFRDYGAVRRAFRLRE